MDEAIKWSKEYRMRLTEPDEVVAFDVMGGDFNLDNMSPGKLNFITFVKITHESESSFFNCSMHESKVMV